MFSSPKALETVGVPTVRGKEALRNYWEQALARTRDLHFQVERVQWHPGDHELAILYNREVNGHQDRAVELLRFDGTGHVTHGEAYGVRPNL